MINLKNDLLTTYLSVNYESNISKLLHVTNSSYRPYDPGQYLYNKVLAFSNENKFLDEFIELAYQAKNIKRTTKPTHQNRNEYKTKDKIKHEPVTSNIKH